MGQHHARLYSELDCELVGVADSNLERAKEVGEKFGVDYYKNYEKLLDKADAVSIAVPTPLHAEVALNSIERRIHCLIEKPITSTIEEAREIIKEAEENDVKLMVGHIERFNPAVIKLKEIIDKGTIGELILISTRRVGPFAPRVKNVGVIVDSATHDIDIARYLVEREPINAFAKSGSVGHGKEDHAIIVLDFGDAAASIEVNWFTPHKVRSLVATGTKAIAYLDYIKQELEIYNYEEKIVPRIEKEEPLKLELKHFLNCVQNNTNPLVDGRVGLKTLEIASKFVRT